ncbi:Serine/threonine-protein kinase PrkC [Enhygromyxa salina]|uniref:Serine/threonine-protein kinase PrkC n=1 Tax=Enhygromyxa salina TaxID=215803 RepID=A0A2S9YFE5_9BACT|nr:serine/threonine-protein kinase [Enhygromyxa salina]PRQ03830.1 Serine/threonine-protein kinase PrkC [Enhygromyxa salina]
MTQGVPALPEVGERAGGGRFDLLAKLGEGGMSGVFRARDHLLGVEVALKLLVPRYLGRPEREQRLIDEGAYLRRLHGHPNIVEISDSGRMRDHNWPWLTTELLHGEVLDWLLVRNKLEAARVIDIARQVATALAACHQSGIVHRDLTPSNLFMLADGTVKLFDFSHAGDLGAPQLGAGAPGRLTGIHETPGTIGYMGPEQAARAPAETAMDVFGFGTLLFELITRRNPFRQFSDRDEFIRAQREAGIEVPRIHAWAYEVPEALAALVHDCTLRDAGERPSITEVIARLAAIGPRRGPAASASTAASSRPPSRRTPAPRIRRGLLALAVGLLVAVGGGWMMLAGEAGSTVDHMPWPAEADTPSQPWAPAPRFAPAPAPEVQLSSAPVQASTRASTCERARDRARAAFDRRRWRQVLAHTERGACWASKRERARLRTAALFNLGRWGECARLGATSDDPKVRSIADACEAITKLDRPEPK